MDSGTPLSAAYEKSKLNSLFYFLRYLIFCCNLILISEWFVLICLVRIQSILRQLSSIKIKPLIWEFQDRNLFKSIHGFKELVSRSELPISTTFGMLMCGS